MSAIHPSIVARACETLLSHPQCPPIGDPVEGTAGLAYAMEAALEAVRDDLAEELRREAQLQYEADIAQADLAQLYPMGWE